MAHAAPQQEAESLAAQRKFVAAAGKFREAYAAEPRPELICNVGVAFHKAADYPRAHRYLRRCLALGKDLEAKFKDAVAKVLTTIEARLAAGEFVSVELSVVPASARVRLDGDTPFDEPLGDGDRVWFPIGDYRVTVSADGFVTRHASLRATRTSALVHSYILEPVPSLTSSVAPRRAEAVSADRASPLLPLIATGSTLAAGVGALVFHLQMRDRAERVGDAADPTERNRLRGAAESALHRTWIAGGIAGVGAVVSGYLWYRWHRTPRTFAVDVETSGAGGGATVTLGGVW